MSVRLGGLDGGKEMENGREKLVFRVERCLAGVELPR